MLRAFYRFEPAQIGRVFEHLLGLGHVNTEESERVAAALPLAAEGMEFADALHLTASQHCEALYTFDDRRFAGRARRLGCGPPVQVPTDEARPAPDDP